MISTSLIINIFEVRLYEKTQCTHKLILIYLLICHEKHYINELKHQILNPISKIYLCIFPTKKLKKYENTKIRK